MLRKLFCVCGLTGAVLLAACGGGSGASTTSTPMVSVPNVVGLSQASATSSLTTAGLILGSVTGQASTTVPAGDVISESPAAGSSIAQGSAVSLVVSGTVSTANTLPVIVDSGPAVLANNNKADVNMLFATVTICTPGTNACQTIDHMQVDTGSWGVQVVSEVLNGAAVPTQLNDPATNAPLRECVQFADGYTWGSVVLVDVIIGGRTISNLPVHLIGDAAAGAAPASCVANLTPENTVVDFGANGLLGIGNFLQDCGQTCVTQVIPALYYVCPPQQSCQETTVALQNQLQNPIGALTGGDSNGVVISLPAVSAPGQATVSGTVYFGISTQANNDLGSAMLFTLDGMGDLITQFNGNTLTSSFIDSGSNGYFFNYNITQCSSTLSPGFYCPASPVPLSATIQGQNGNTATVKFTVDNADALAQSGDAANPGRAGPNNAPNGPTNGFDWGLPFFFGRSVYVLFETYTVNGTTGPAVGF